MKILHIETGRHLYGGALQVFYLMRGLASKNCRNLLLCPRESAIGKAAAEVAEVHAVPMNGEIDPLFALRLIRLIRSAEPDVIHVHSRRGADLWGAVAACFTRVPAILTRRVDNPEPRWLARLKYRPFQRIVTISEGIRQVLLNEGIPESRLCCIHSAVDTRRYDRQCDKKRFYEMLPEAAADGPAPKEKLIGVIAQLIPRKGHRFIIEAAPAILQACPQTRLIFFGKGPLKNRLQELCRREGITGHVIFAGFRNDLDCILPCLDLVVHPAVMEGLGVSLLQAAAAGVPIIASRAGGIPEIVRHNRNGYLIEKESVADIIKYVPDLLKNPAKARQFGETGRDIVRSRFSIDAMVSGYLDVYNGLAARWKASGTTPHRHDACGSRFPTTRKFPD